MTDVPAGAPSREGGTAAGYRPVEYLQFGGGPALRLARAVAGALTWPLVLPLALLSRLSDVAFRTASELLAFVPYALGIVVRAEFYRFALRACGRNLVVESGTVFCYRDVSVGDHVLLGRYCVVHECDLGSYVLAGERCTFLSGSRQHGHARLDVPMALQAGQRRRIRVADDCWLGSHAVIMHDVGHGAIVGAGSVVTEAVPARAIVAGNPARVLRMRGEGGT
jgi:acetyltransferase-like isoleucine patch superfamily enzyme